MLRRATWVVALVLATLVLPVPYRAPTCHAGCSLRAPATRPRTHVSVALCALRLMVTAVLCNFRIVFGFSITTPLCMCSSLATRGISEMFL